MKAIYLISSFLVSSFILNCCAREKQHNYDFRKPLTETRLKIETKQETPSGIQTKLKKKKSSLTKALLYDKLQNPVQAFELSSAKDTSLTGNQGTKLEIRKNSFLLNGKPYEGSVSLHLKECYSYEDMVLHNLSTQSNDRLLESGGMICLEAFTNDHQKLTLDRAQPIGLQMPSEAPKQYMQLFYADKNMNWLQASDSKPQFAQVSNNSKKSRSSTIQAGNYFITDNGFGTVITTVNILTDGVERQLSSTSYACQALYQPLRDSLSLYFELDANGYIYNSRIRDTVFSKNLKITPYKLISMNDASLNYSVYTPRSMGDDCNLLLRSEYIGMKNVAEFSFIVPRTVYTALKKNSTRANRSKVVVRNTYIFRSNNAGRQQRINNLQAKLDSNGGSVKDISVQDLQYYAFSINQLGWINCDRFYNVPASQKTNFTIASQDGVDLKLVFTDMKSVLTGYRTNDGFVFNNIPKNKPVTLIGIRIVNDKAELAILKTITQESCQDPLVYTQVSVEELKEKIKTML